MSQHEQARWIVAYDIGHPRRWANIYKLLKMHGIALQYSVFQVDASAVQISVLMAKLDRLIDSRADDIRAYRVPEAGGIYKLGVPMLPDDMWITGSNPRGVRL